MSARIDARRDAGGVSATSSAITDVASRRLATSRWQSTASGQVTLEGLSFVVVECVDDVSPGQCVQ